MTNLAKEQIRNMTDPQIIAYLKRAALFEREHREITWDDGFDLVNIVAVHGDRIAGWHDLN